MRYVKGEIIFTNTLIIDQLSDLTLSLFEVRWWDLLCVFHILCLASVSLNRYTIYISLFPDEKRLGEQGKITILQIMEYGHLGPDGRTLMEKQGSLKALLIICNTYARALNPAYSCIISLTTCSK